MNQEYREFYLKSYRWKHLRKFVLDNSRGLCFCCGYGWISVKDDDDFQDDYENKLEVHHISYKTLNTDEEIDDLIAVCMFCHEDIHSKAQSGICKLNQAHLHIQSLRERQGLYRYEPPRVKENCY